MPIDFSNLCFERLTNLKSPLFDQVIDIYNYSFPDSERRPINYLIDYLNKDISHLYIVRSETIVLGLALFNNIPDSDFVLFDYLAVNKDFRSSGIGTFIINELVKMNSNNNKYLLLEVEHPNFGSNTQERINRLEFYKNFNPDILKDYYYALPDFTGDGEVEMILLIMPEYNSRKIDKNELDKSIKHIYLDFYKRKLDDKTLNKILNNNEEIILYKDYK